MLVKRKITCRDGFGRTHLLVNTVLACHQQSPKNQLLRRQRPNYLSPRRLTGTIFFPPFVPPRSLYFPYLRLTLQPHSTVPPLYMLPNSQMSPLCRTVRVALHQIKPSCAISSQAVPSVIGLVLSHSWFRGRLYTTSEHWKH